VISDPDWDVTEMVDRWMAGESPLKLSRAYGVPESEIRHHLKRLVTHQMEDMRRLRPPPEVPATRSAQTKGMERSGEML
jgi:hypothetical protein